MRRVDLAHVFARPRRSRLAALVLVAAFLAPGCLGAPFDLAHTQPPKAELLIAAASDLRPALVEIIAGFEAGHPGAKVEAVMGSSGKFYTQILNGAPFEMYFSADIAYPQMLHENGSASQPTPYAIGRIVLWSATLDVTQMQLEDLARSDIRTIAIANPTHAPYGRRAQEALVSAGVWEEVRPKLVMGENIAQAAQFAQSGAADVGILALSLALTSALEAEGSRALIAADMHAPLEQGFVITTKGADNPLAAAFAQHMTSGEARAILTKYGFEPPADGA